MIRSLCRRLGELCNALRIDRITGAVGALMHVTASTGGAFAATPPPSAFAIIEGLGDVACAFSDGSDTHLCLSDQITGRSSMWSVKTGRRALAPKGCNPANEPTQWKEIGAVPLPPRKYWPPGYSRPEAIIFGDSVITAEFSGNSYTPFNIPMILTRPQTTKALYIVARLSKPRRVFSSGDIYPPQSADFNFIDAFLSEVIPIDSSSGLLLMFGSPTKVGRKNVVQPGKCAYTGSYVLMLGRSIPPKGVSFDDKFFLIPADALSIRPDATLKERSAAIDLAVLAAEHNQARVEHVCTSKP